MATKYSGPGPGLVTLTVYCVNTRTSHFNSVLTPADTCTYRDCPLTLTCQFRNRGHCQRHQNSVNTLLKWLVRVLTQYTVLGWDLKLTGIAHSCESFSVVCPPSAASVPLFFSLAMRPHSARAIVLLSLWLAATTLPLTVCAICSCVLGNDCVLLKARQ